MNETSRLIIKAATTLNQQSKSPIVAYSIDAGFHVFLFTQKKDAEVVLKAVQGLEGVEKVIQTRIGREGVKMV